MTGYQFTEEAYDLAVKIAATVLYPRLAQAARNTERLCRLDQQPLSDDQEELLLQALFEAGDGIQVSLAEAIMAHEGGVLLRGLEAS